ncbi:hypothetical protein ACFV80_34125 [Streptomyces sp. NPDC059862]|uniref:hypothetical protein n=1 Tax=Streptomyces sp. NPDC059862 TaxID=3346975 RepID=UPI0036539BE6
MNDRPARRPSSSQVTGSTQRRRQQGRLFLGALVGSAVFAVTATGLAVRHDAEPDRSDRISVGRTCRSTLGQELELSCGTYGFGDLRHVCPTAAAGGGRCVPTKAVTVRNTGPSTVYVTVINGPRQGIRVQGGEREITPGHSATLRPREGQLLFDITLRGAGGDPKSLTVTRVQ